MAQADLMLDPKIRDWVLLPIVLVMILVGIGRSMVQILLKSEEAVDKDAMKHRMLLTRSGRLRLSGNLLPPHEYCMRKEYFVAKPGGKLREKVQSGAPNPMANPNGMVNMMKNNMTMMVPNVLMMGWISYFFSGFVLVKVPFTLTESFKTMLQRGVELESLDVSYVSSLSWYFLVMFGLRGVFMLLLGSNVPDDAAMMQAQMGMGMGGGNMAFDASKAYKSERDALRLAKYKWVVEESEAKLLKLSPVPQVEIGSNTSPTKESSTLRQRK